MQKTLVSRGIQSVRAEAPAAGEIKALIEGVNQAFANFKEENNAALEGVKKGQADALQALKVDRINADIEKLQSAVDEANTRIAAAQMQGVAQGGLKDKEYSAAFRSHMKRGEIQAALNKGVAGEGGYLAPTEWDRTITDKLVQVSPMRELASVQTISTAAYSKLFNNMGVTSGWVGEAAARPVTATPTFGTLTYTTGEIYANPSATQGMLDDAEIDLESWLAGEVQTEFAYQEGVAFLAGDGTNKPNGILTYVTGGANAAVHPWGAITTVNSGAAAALTTDGVLSLIYALPSEFTGNARFVMNRATQGLARKLKDGQGNYIWQPSYVAGQPSTIAGFSVTEVAGMPDVAAAAKAVLFGDFKRTYLVIDRIGVRVIRDNLTNKPYVSFYTTKRVGGGLLNPETMRAMNVAL
ncbi:MAG: phage major capsid protein [Polaromonas sp.]|nr:phage major capsid protein [Polaromonas sp.]